ncbi:hypothetical protein V6N13_134267 [Hibiscus sabdariffa]
MSRPDRATWLEVSGIPPYCWNDVTLRRVAELWGYFESLGENANHRLNCEKVTVLITTNQVNRIEEIVELNVGNMKYEINVVEIGFKDETCDPLLMKGNMNKIDHFGDSIMKNQSESSLDTGKSSLPLDDKLNCSVEKDALEVMNIGSKPKGNVERSIESSSKSAQSKSSDKMNRNWSKVVQNLSQTSELNRACMNPVEDEAINVVHIGKDHIEGCFSAALELDRQLAEVDIMGAKLDKDCARKAVEKEVSCEGGLSVQEQCNDQLGLTNCLDFSLGKDTSKSPREAVGQDLEVNTNGKQDSQLENMDLVTSQALEDIRCMGLQTVVGETLNPLERTKGKSYWEACVDKQNNAQMDLGVSTAYPEILDTLEESSGFFPELATKRRKGKRYDSSSLNILTASRVSNINFNEHQCFCYVFMYSSREVKGMLILRSRSGKRFVVRFASQADADRGILRLNGFIFFGYRVSVSRAKFGSRTSYWRKVTTNWDRSGQRQRPSQFPASPMAARNVNNNINNKSTRPAE